MQRHERLEQDAKVALSQIITYEVKNPSVTGLISVTDVKITPDQKYAKIYISIFGKQNKEKVIEALKQSSGFIRTELGKSVRMRNVPALVFELDDSIEYGTHMDKIISDVVKKDKENNKN
ncbi:MAG: 30S ribosome-binding factor RbfA [Clostridia bacterium]|nr:30S ribosome-binding factor RbfA [Clostridia bacterium]